ncbi:hypothetical protein NDK50_02460 [Paraburkholderia bryophila]|uniref:hypothetical protein n=1 Tax=Paraburkholderia bryophila TaxID=420952 RepID=UPI00234A8565|nr:hypothetical protein [Paraburkholderia bryophila]WCM20358.1 hypothetical protein NDK50_02460 [Paraburkholderia bryophila]
MEETQLARHLKTIADEAWAKSNGPALLSNLPGELRTVAGGDDYRDALGKRTLKAFIAETGSANGYKLIEHPTQRAKVGLLPADAEFSFPFDSKAEQNACNQRTGVSDVVTLLTILGKLPPEDLEKITIPVSVLVKLWHTE